MKNAGTIPRYYAALDFEKLWQAFPPAPEYLETTYLMSHDAMRALQEERFLEQMKRAWQIPFYQRHWGNAGLEAGDIRSLNDLKKIPAFSVHDLRDAIARNPPWGDFIGIDPDSDTPMPLALQTSGGTTGLPRPMIYSPQDREVMNIITGRRLYMQGVRPYDLIQVTLSLGLSNGGFLAREGIWKYTGAVPVMTGSGAQTPTRRQIEILQAWKAKHLIGFPAYLRHMGQVMRDDVGIDPRSMGIRSLIVHLGTDDRKPLEDLWNADVFDTYGTNECGSLAAECQEKNGMHVFEDAFVLEMIDPETGQDVGEGNRGTIYQTTLFKHLAPLIRFNSHDVSAFMKGTCKCGCTHKRIDRIFGRSDNMVKLRGTNIFPEAIGALISQTYECNGEYVCIVEPGSAGQDEMTVRVEVSDLPQDGSLVQQKLADNLKLSLGVKMKVIASEPGSLSALTGLKDNSKVRRLIDNRPKV